MAIVKLNDTILTSQLKIQLDTVPKKLCARLLIIKISLDYNLCKTILILALNESNIFQFFCTTASSAHPIVALEHISVEVIGDRQSLYDFDDNLYRLSIRLNRR